MIELALSLLISDDQEYRDFAQLAATVIERAIVRDYDAERGFRWERMNPRLSTVRWQLAPPLSAATPHFGENTYRRVGRLEGHDMRADIAACGNAEFMRALYIGMDFRADNMILAELARMGALTEIVEVNPGRRYRFEMENRIPVLLSVSGWCSDPRMRSGQRCSSSIHIQFDVDAETLARCHDGRLPEPD